MYHTAVTCSECGKPLPIDGRSETRRTCSHRCRARRHRIAKAKRKADLLEHLEQGQMTRTEVVEALRSL